MQVRTPADPFIDTRGLHKGQLRLGERKTGRFWSLGSVHTLYLPLPWLRPGINRVVAFDLAGNGNVRIGTVNAPVFGKSTGKREKQ